MDSVRVDQSSCHLRHHGGVALKYTLMACTIIRGGGVRCCIEWSRAAQPGRVGFRGHSTDARHDCRRVPYCVPGTPGSSLWDRRSRPGVRGNRHRCQREAETPCVPPCSASSLIQAVSSTAQSHRPLKRRVSALAPSLRTSLDGTDDGGRHFRIEQSATADPASHTPVEVSLPRRGCPRPCTESDGRPRPALTSLRACRGPCLVQVRSC